MILTRNVWTQTSGLIESLPLYSVDDTPQYHQFSKSIILLCKSRCFVWMSDTYMHTLPFRTSACLSCSHSTAPCGSRRCRPHCRPRLPVGRRPCSTRSHLWGGSRLVDTWEGPLDTHRATYSTVCGYKRLWVVGWRLWRGALQWNSGRRPEERRRTE